MSKSISKPGTFWVRLVGGVGSGADSRATLASSAGSKEGREVVPGGQQEIFTTRSWGQEVFCYRAHKGFVRLALKHRARLVRVQSSSNQE